MANVHRAKGQRAVSFREFMPVFDLPKRQSAAEQIALVAAITQHLGGQDNRPKGND